MSGFSPYGAAPDGARSQTESVWHYLRPGHSSADVSWEGLGAYTRPAYDAANANFSQFQNQTVDLIATAEPGLGTPEMLMQVKQAAVLELYPALGTPQALAYVGAAGTLQRSTLAAVLGSAATPGTIQKSSLAVVLAAELPGTSKVYLGSTLINEIYLGSTPITAAYLGSTQVFG